MKFLGIDYGLKRIGLATTDPLGIIASPYGVIENKGEERNITAIKNLCDELKIGKIVMGLPLNMNGTESEMSARVREFKNALEVAVNLEVILIDERLTSRLAENTLKEKYGRDYEAVKERVDSVSASVILQTYIH
ncbi:MAG: Holliday junction resolvase RuvX [Christensenellaceae bacterium]|jgi:putative Holliday junction resolvase|nr:Holliday junction resolvase RuvX [Christensenellaceae bacterium]